MSKRKSSIHVTVSSSGTYNVDVSPNTFPPTGLQLTKLSYVFSGSATAPYTIAPTGSPDKDTFVEIVWNANLTIGASALQIFGANIPNELIASKFIAECLYDGAAWIVTVRPSFDEVGIVDSDRLAASSVTTAKIEDNAVTLAKMAGLAKGKIIYGDASGNPADIELGSADGRMLLGDTAAGVAAVDMSGDATISKAGALTIANDAISTVKIADDAVTAAKLDDDANRVQVVIPVSFESAGEIGAVDYKICFPCTIEAIHGTVTKTFTSTGTHVFKDNGGTVLTGSQIDMSSALLLGNIVSSTPTANNTFVAGDVIRIETSVSGGVGGKSSVVLCMLKS
jgi:hypothetical protein